MSKGLLLEKKIVPSFSIVIHNKINFKKKKLMLITFNLSICRNLYFSISESFLHVARDTNMDQIGDDTIIFIVVFMLARWHTEEVFRLCLLSLFKFPKIYSLIQRVYPIFVLTSIFCYSSTIETSKTSFSFYQWNFKSADNSFLFRPYPSEKFCITI